jgi:phage antirepressor YoqD-like protein
MPRKSIREVAKQLHIKDYELRSFIRVAGQLKSKQIDIIDLTDKVEKVGGCIFIDLDD